MYEKWVALLRNRQVRAHIVGHTADALVRIYFTFSRLTASTALQTELKIFLPYILRFVNPKIA
jgi:hypothetical protein